VTITEITEVVKERADYDEAIYAGLPYHKSRSHRRVLV
jgi:hypothetical protein